MKAQWGMTDAGTLWINTERGGFIISPHFVERAQERAHIPAAAIPDFIAEVAQGARFIKRPCDRKRIAAEHGSREVRYLYDEATDWCFVVEYNPKAREFNFLRTLYRGADSMWITRWRQRYAEAV